MNDPDLFEEDDIPLHVRERLYAEEDDSDNNERPIWRRALKWMLITCLGVFLFFHLYALALRFISPPGTILMASQAVSGVDIKRRWVPLENISPHLVTAVIAAEDQRFCQHSGVDIDATKLAFQEWRNGEGLRGGSTITQQTAKNIFLWNGGGFVRKVPEAWMAFVIDTGWGKRRVMEMYLNMIEWGDGIFGAEAAARIRFGKPAADLTKTEAALLATVLPSPNRWRLDPPGQYVQRRTRRTLQQMKNVERDGLAACVLNQ